VWTLHVPLLVHRTMLSPTRSYKCGNIKWGGNKWSGNRWFTRSNDHTFGFLDLTHDSKIEALSKHIDVQRGIVEMCKKLIIEWKALFSHMHKSTIDLSTTLATLENRVLVCKWHECVIKDIVSQSFRGFLLRRPPPQPYFELQVVIEFMWLPIKKCVFCGLGFAPMWVA
jgi:hypothetical protein